MLAFDDRTPRAFGGALIPLSADDGMGLLHSLAPGGANVQTCTVWAQNAYIWGLQLIETRVWEALSPAPIDTPLGGRIHVERGPIACRLEFGSGPFSPLLNQTPQAAGVRNTTQVNTWQLLPGRPIFVPFGWSLLASTRTGATGTGFAGVNFQWTENLDPERGLAADR